MKSIPALPLFILLIIVMIVILPGLVYRNITPSSSKEGKAENIVTGNLRNENLNLDQVIEVSGTSCQKGELWGTAHQGGWYICRDALPIIPDASDGKPCVVYSYGLGADWSFDMAAENYGCEVHGFDPSNQEWAAGLHGNEYSHFRYARQYPSAKKFFHNWGVGVANQQIFQPGTVPQEWPGLGDPPLSKTNSHPWELRSIEQTMKDLNHIESGLSILKIDVEGAEWETLTAFFSSKFIEKLILAGKIPQILAEFHWDPNSTLKNDRNKKLLGR